MTAGRCRTIFVIGGARSGKSSFALGKAGAFPGKKAYVATAEAIDEEMKERIRRHKEERDGSWETIEEPVRIADVLKKIGSGHDAVVIDCLTIWLSNLLFLAEDPETEIEKFLSLLRKKEHPPFLVVSNEVGMGIVPDNPVSRRFRDLAGKVNQKVAGIADEVYLIAAGLPLRIKP